MLPWVEPMLESVKKEYSKPHPQYSMKEPSSADMHYIYHIVKDSSPVDELKLKNQLLADLKMNRTGIWKSYSPLGEIIYIGDKERVNLPVWWRCIRLLSKRPVRIVIFSHPLIINTSKSLQPPLLLAIANIPGSSTLLASEKYNSFKF